jgi:hypothetical protein
LPRNGALQQQWGAVSSYANTHSVLPYLLLSSLCLDSALGAAAF